MNMRDLIDVIVLHESVLNQLVTIWDETESLAYEFSKWTAENGFGEEGDAEDLLMIGQSRGMTAPQRAWLVDFIRRWKSASKTEQWGTSHPQRLSLADFFRSNEDGIGPEEQQEIIAGLKAHGEYHGGGGAFGEWTITLR